jgi:hypothetical protein
MSALLGSGDERQGRPLLGGAGAGEYSSSSPGARGASGFLPTAALEAFARVAQSVASGGVGGLPPRGSGGGGDTSFE